MRRIPFRLAIAVAGTCALLCGPTAVLAQEQAKEPTARGGGGAAATADALATEAAISTLTDGGNAVDAAVVAAAVLGVTEPFSCGIGGGGFMVIRTAKGDVTTIDGREKAPRAMKPDSFMENGRPLAFDPARFSGLSAGVPGTPLTWSRALNKYGTISLREALAPGIRAATIGFTVDKVFFDSVEAVKDYFDDVPSTAAIYLDPDGTSKDVGARITQPGHGEDVPDPGPQRRPQGLLPRRRGRGDGGGGDHAADRPDRQPRLAAGPDDDGRPHALHGARPREPVDVPVPRPRGLRHGPAVQRRHDRRRGAEHPRGLRAAGRVARPDPAPLPGGVALRVRRPQRLPRRPGVLRRAGAGAWCRTPSRPSGAR